MTHPATTRAATLFLQALGAPVDVGLVYPPREGETRGRGIWYACNVNGARDIAPLLNRAAAGNAAGAAVFVRLHSLGDDPTTPHAGIVLIDDLNAASVRRLAADRLPACATVETSPSNFQVWVRLADAGEMSRRDAVAAARELASRYGGDPKAVGSGQPGRLPGFTNRKPKYQRGDGRFPFVRLIEAKPGLIGPGAAAFFNSVGDAVAPRAQPARAARGALETPQAAGEGTYWNALDDIRVAQWKRIESEVASGRRPAAAGSQSEVDFAAAVQALTEDVPPGAIEAWLAVRRSDHHASYAGRTVANAARYVIDRSNSAYRADVARPA